MPNQDKKIRRNRLRSCIELSKLFKTFHSHSKDFPPPLKEYSATAGKAPATLREEETKELLWERI